MATGISADDTWKVEQDMRTLIEADAIRNDKKRLKAAQTMAKAKLEEMEATFGDSEADGEKD
ncbi:MAG TPA: hypothetical protein PKZ07_19300 [Sedimentisphaerales bacterium]|nr:hypothetical protein [Sedimentisphaerales bacterium]